MTRRDQLLLSCVLTALTLVLCRCKSSDPPQRSGSEVTREFSKKLHAASRRLAELGSDSERLQITDADRIALQNALGRFQRSLREHALLTEEIDGWKAVDREQFEDAWRRGETLGEKLQTESAQINSILESLAAKAASSEDQETKEYLDFATNASGVAQAIDKHLIAVHTEAIARETEIHGAASVFHLLSLRKLDRTQFSRQTRLYEGAWQKWVDSDRERGRHDNALAVFALIMDATDEAKPSSPGAAHETALDSIRSAPSMSVVEAMERRLREIRERAEKLPGRERWERELRRADAAVMLARARATADPKESLSLAVAARDKDRYLDQQADALIKLSADRIGARHVSAHRYEKALEEFRRATNLRSHGAKESSIEAFRKTLVNSALRGAEGLLRQAEFAAAKDVLGQAQRLTSNNHEEQLVAKKLHRYYARFVAHLLPRDARAATQECERMLVAFPHDRQAMENLDRCLYQVLLQDIGELSTAFERHGGRRVQELIRDTVRKMRTTAGTERCQTLFEQTQESWLTRLDDVSGPSEAFKIARETAILSREEPDELKPRAVARLWKLAGDAANAKNWPLLKECIDTYLRECPAEKAPTGFAESHQRLVRELVRTSDGDATRHAVLYLRAHPEAVGSIRPIVVRHVSQQPQIAAAVDSMLDGQITQESPRPAAFSDVVSDSDWEAARIVAGDRVAAHRPGRGGPDPATGAAAAKASHSQHSGRGVYVATVAIAAIGSICGAIVLAALTRKRGLLDFRWYGACGLLFGITLGLLFSPGAFNHSPRETTTSSQVKRVDQHQGIELVLRSPGTGKELDRMP